jgi:hypothetical protein
VDTGNKRSHQVACSRAAFCSAEGRSGACFVDEAFGGIRDLAPRLVVVIIPPNVQIDEDGDSV